MGVKIPVPVYIKTKRDIFLLIVFIFFWLVPLTYTGMHSQFIHFFPNVLNNLANCSCLFTKTSRYWFNYYFQVLHEGQDQWISISQSDLATMKPFGYRTRLTHYLSFATRDESKLRAQRATAHFVRERYQLLNPNVPPLQGVRIVRVAYSVGGEIARPSGHWQIPPLDSVPSERWGIFPAYYFSDGKGND